MVVLILANSADPDEMQHYAAFHLGLHCLPKYPFMGFPVYKELEQLNFSAYEIVPCADPGVFARGGGPGLTVRKQL